MADKGGERKAKAKRENASVLGNLPATRPQRLGRPRDGAPPAAVAEPAPPPPRKRESPRRPARSAAPGLAEARGRGEGRRGEARGGGEAPAHSLKASR